MIGLAMHADTPVLNVNEPRGLPVRTVQYCRMLAGEMSETRVSQTLYGAAGQPSSQRDPRLFALAPQDPEAAANLRTITSLSGRLLKQISADAGTSVTLFGAAGEACVAWDSRGTQRSVMYDLSIRPVAVYEQQLSSLEAGRCLERFTYASAELAETGRNNAGRLIRHDDPAGCRSILDYGLCGAPLQVDRHYLLALNEPDWPEDVAGRDMLMETEAYSTTWKHDALGVMTGQTDARGNQQLHAYTVAGQLAKTALALKGKAPKVVLDAIGYDASGQVLTQTAGNNATTLFQYDPADGRLFSSCVRKGDGALCQSLEYAYDPAGNVTSIKDNVSRRRFFKQQRIDPVSLFHYDTLYQLTEASGRESVGSVIGPSLPARNQLLGKKDDSVLGNYTQRYTYDAGGNLTQLQHLRTDKPYTHTMLVAPHSNRSLAWKEGAPMPDIEEGFDGNGNQRALEGRAMHWNGRNQLVRVPLLLRREGVDDDEVYVYDGGGQRIRKVLSTLCRAAIKQVEVRYLPGIELRADSTGATLQVIDVAAGQGAVKCLHWEVNPPEGLANDQLRYQVSDHLGSCLLELDQQARLITRESYYPYGGTASWAAREAVEAQFKTHRYARKERDATGLYYFGLRYYAPWLQRWINPDPGGGVDGHNAFRAFKNNPLTFADPNGGDPEIPKIAHYVWLGGNLPDYARSNIISFAMDNPDWSVNVWTDNPAKLKGHLVDQGLSSDAFLHFHVWDVKQAIETVPEHLRRDFSGVYAREVSGPYRNYAAASDLLRLAILYQWGGLYMDTDVFVKPGESFGRVEASRPSTAGLLFFETGGRGTEGNLVMAGRPKFSGTLSMLSRAVDSYVRDVSRSAFEGSYFNAARQTENYRAPGLESDKISDDVVWEHKRSFEHEGFGRRMLTLGMTGPGLIKEYLFPFFGREVREHRMGGSDRFGVARESGKRIWLSQVRPIGDWVSPPRRTRRASI